MSLVKTLEDQIATLSKTVSLMHQERDQFKETVRSLAEKVWGTEGGEWKAECGVRSAVIGERESGG